MTTQKEADKDTKTTETKEVAPAEIERGQGGRFYFPEHGISIVAKTREEAHTKLEETLNKDKKND